MKRIRSLALMCAGLMVISACGIAGGGGDEPETGGSAVGSEEATTSPADATITIRSERDTVMINDEAVASGQVQDGVAGDTIAVDVEGSVTITAQSVLEIEALRGGTLTIPDLGSDPIVVPMEARATSLCGPIPESDRAARDRHRRPHLHHQGSRQRVRSLPVSRGRQLPRCHPRRGRMGRRGRRDRELQRRRGFLRRSWLRPPTPPAAPTTR